MTTKRQIVELAYASVGLAGFVYDLQPEQLELARRILDSQMATLNIKGIRLGWPIPSSPDSGDLDEETNLPDVCWRGSGHRCHHARAGRVSGACQSRIADRHIQNRRGAGA